MTAFVPVNCGAANCDVTAHFPASSEKKLAGALSVIIALATTAFALVFTSGAFGSLVKLASASATRLLSLSVSIFFSIRIVSALRCLIIGDIAGLLFEYD